MMLSTYKTELSHYLRTYHSFCQLLKNNYFLTLQNMCPNWSSTKENQHVSPFSISNVV